MRRLQVEVVARPVEVHREQHDAVHPVLLAVRLRLHQHHLLGEAVGGVGLLGIAVPEVVLLERHRRELRVGADGPERDQLGDAGQAALLEDVQAHHRVLEQEAPRVVPVGADAADARREVDHQIRLRVRRSAAARRRGRPGRIRPSAGRTTDGALAAQPLDHEAPKNPAPPVTTTRRPCQNVLIRGRAIYHQNAWRRRPVPMAWRLAARAAAAAASSLPAATSAASAVSSRSASLGLSSGGAPRPPSPSRRRS